MRTNGPHINITVITTLGRFMSRMDDLDLHHIQRKKDKKKRHQKGFNEDVVMEKRATRVSFKNYVRQLEEQMLEIEDDEVDFED